MDFLGLCLQHILSLGAGAPPFAVPWAKNRDAEITRDAATF
jgi:hypothetical protein